MSRLKMSLVLVLTVMAASLAAARVSDPMGCYALIEKVVLEPNDTEPTSIQIWGAFSIGTREANGFATYATPESGYLYYSCAPKQDATCLNEWTDLKGVAGKDQVVGFGTRYQPFARVRKATEKPASPDVYRMQFGVVKMDKSLYPGMSEALHAALRKK